MSALVVASATATALAVLLARPPAGWVLGVRLGGRASAGWNRAIHAPVAIGLSAVVVVIVAATSPPSLMIVAVSAAGTVLFVLRQVRLARQRSAAVRVRAQTTAALDLLAAELRAGVLPSHALAAVTDDAPVLRAASVAAAHGGDVVAALRSAATEPGANALADLAAAWHVASRAGAPLADVLDRVVATVRDDADIDRDVQAEAAPARATGRLMAVLPLFGLTLGAGLGADPVHVLTGTVVGAMCLAGGLALACAGVAWVDRIVTSVETA